MNWPVFFQRLGSAILFSAVMMAGLLHPHPMAILALVYLIQFLCIGEFFKISRAVFSDSPFSNAIQWLTQLAGLLVTTAIATGNVEAMTLVLLLPVLLLLTGVLQKKTALIPALCAVAALCYISLPLGFLAALKYIHLAIPLSLVLMIWMNDTMAYLVGSFIGKTPFSAISPKKTWEGTLGGAVLTLAGAAIWGVFNRLSFFDLWDWLLIGAIAVVAGTAGDLFESKLKRLAGLKDSGRIMPGHGGALDRFDSLLVALPFTFCYVYLVLR